MKAFGLSVTLSDVRSPDKRLELVLTSLSERLAKKGSGVIITVDELQAADADETRAVGNVLQIVANRRRFPIVFVGAGLPSLKRSLLTGQQATFLQRCSRYRVGRISPADVQQALCKPLESISVPIDDDALEMMVEATDGYPYMVQLVGEKVWKAAENPLEGLHAEHAEIGVRAARGQLAKAVIEPELNKLDRTSRVLFRHLVDSESMLTLSQLAEAAQSDSEAAQSNAETATKKRLQQMIDAGLVEETDDDRYEFAFPTTREWVKSRLDPGRCIDDAPWQVPAPATPSENGTHQISKRARMEETLRQHPQDSYHSVALQHDESAVHVHRVAVDAGLTRFCWRDLFLHLRSRLRKRQRL